ncbi:MAG: cobyric acid synthase [Desulfovibrio sp.]|jgi:adenosylcobyric acid synthase|nr:cobyric acid synthase [Desulfovibrio sp.]
MRSAVKNLPPVFPVPALMVQGVSSNAGKSLLAAALCRIFARRGLSVAPFKAQNMALNSFVTRDGKEMGRAQALQAQACGMEADVRMNPVLLKPTSRAGSQIIVMGAPVGLMRAREYQQYKTTVWKAVRTAYRGLSDGRDVMVLEGAGSPAEINLKAYDIVNMRMARFAGARVLLVADIDRGGAFAGVVGTMSLLGRADRGRVAGYVLNKFRGDASLLEPALAAVSLRTRKPFLGIVPMLTDLRLPEEDSVGFKEGDIPRIFSAPAPSDLAARQCLDIAVVDLPYISNFTDLDALRYEPGVRVRTIRAAVDMGRPDAIILPGSKNTLADLRFLRESGLAGGLCRYAGEGGTLVGICGGLQLLGKTIADPLGLEDGGEAPALGLLPLHTLLGSEKQLRRVEGKAFAALAESEAAVAGYEIHHGVTAPDGDIAPVPVLEDRQGRIIGWGRRGLDGGASVWGTYLHGIFDMDAFRHAFLNRLRRKAGFALLSGIVYSIGPELDRLADTVEQCLDMKAVYSLIGEN